MRDEQLRDLVHIKYCFAGTTIFGSVSFICSNDHPAQGLILGIIGLIGIIFAAIAGINKDDKIVSNVESQQKDS